MDETDRLVASPVGRRGMLRALRNAALVAIAGSLPTPPALAQVRPAPMPGREPGRPGASARASGFPMLSPQTVDTTGRAIAYYESVVARGGWPAIGAIERLQRGMRHPAVAALRYRLTMEGDLDPGLAEGAAFDPEVEVALLRFQVRNGLAPDGVVRDKTLAALDVPAATRLEQLRINLVRLRSMSGNLGTRYVMCNIPAARIEAIENGMAVSRHSAVVGKPDRPSPDIQSRIVEINFNPFWTVPVSIVRRDLIPRMQAEPDYLTKNRIRIIDASGYELSPAQVNWFSAEAANYRFKQDPGDFNSLGSIRINFPSAHGVYMHDTPYKNLFGDDFRFHSSGCVRVQDVRELVYWLLAESPEWPRAEIDQVIESGERRDARIGRPVPIYWVYVTAWVGADGVAQFRDDIYGRDGTGTAYAPVNRG